MCRSVALAIAIAIVAQAAPTTWEDAVVPETDFVTSVTYDYTKIHSSGDCCRNNGALVHHVANGGAQTPADCEPACSANPDCHYFSHSNQWKNCALCSQCDFTTSGNGKYYTSWERTPVIPIPSIAQKPNDGGIKNGMYYRWDDSTPSDWDTVFGGTWSNNKEYTVKLCRDGSAVWTGVILSWDSKYGKTGRRKCAAHGDADDECAPGNFQVGDQLIKPSSSCSSCDASAAPTNGAKGTCNSALASGSTCQPTCNTGYTVSGTSSCSAGTLTAATCAATERYVGLAGDCPGNNIEVRYFTNKQNCENRCDYLGPTCVGFTIGVNSLGTPHCVPKSQACDLPEGFCDNSPGAGNCFFKKNA